MSADGAYAELTAHLRRMAALEQVAGLLNWDQETSMPPSGGSQRAEQIGAVASLLHALASDPRLGALAEAVLSADARGAVAVNATEALRAHRRATRVPAALAQDLARRGAMVQMAWESAKMASDFPAFAPHLSDLLDLKRQEARCLAEKDQSPYDALLQDYEPGIDASTLDVVFGRLRAGLRDLRERIAGSSVRPVPLSGHFPAAAQLELARDAATAFGYDWKAGRLDLAAHPSSSGSMGDVRITTRIDPGDPRDCLYSTIHEVGHAVYEQNLDPEHAFLPAGAHASMGVHESQSRLFENQIGRSRAFCDWLHPRMVARFGADAGPGPDALFAAINAVETGFIRTEADEIHYNLHVMMRFDLERDLISGSLDVADLEDAWNSRFARDFGREVPDARRGVLQDVHWAAGLFGYFPTYALGNIYAGEIHSALHRDLPDLDAHFSEGDLAPVTEWLRSRIHRRGRLLKPAGLIEEAVGHAPTERPLMTYLEEKYGALYAL